MEGGSLSSLSSNGNKTSKNSENSLKDEQSCMVFYTSKLTTKILNYLKKENFCSSEDLTGKVKKGEWQKIFPINITEKGWNLDYIKKTLEIIKKKTT